MSLSQNPEPALHRITGNRIAHRFGDSQTQTTIRRPIIRLMIITHQVMHNDVFATHFAPAFKYGDEITMALKPLHLDYACGTDRNDQAERVLRPLARRRLITARPERVRMRRRKPCFMWRRRLFGWNVLFISIAPRSIWQRFALPSRESSYTKVLSPLPSSQNGRRIFTFRHVARHAPNLL